MTRTILILLNLILFSICSVAQSSDTVQSTCRYDTTYIDNNTILHWHTSNESGSKIFEVQQYLWGKWRTVDSVIGTGLKQLSHYQVKVCLHNGKNRFRIVQATFAFKDDGSKHNYMNSSMPILKHAKLKKLKYDIKKDTIHFSREINYMLKNDDGIIIQGKGNNIPVKDVSKEVYTMYFGTQTEEIELK